ncbi:MAG: accessory factor UbiK family protein [Ketobacteraceae bacterium]|nr:accessory factor UbiK family protein [Ketobacteraceae bacterium]
MSDNLRPEQLVRQVLDLVKEAIPPGLGEVGQDLKQNLRTTISESLANLDMVTREEFEVQRKVLARTRQKLEALEKRAAELEALAEQQLQPDKPEN